MTESKPDLVLFVCVALFGNNAMEQLSMFQGTLKSGGHGRPIYRRDCSNEVRHRERQGGGGADPHAHDQGAVCSSPRHCLRIVS